MRPDLMPPPPFFFISPCGIGDFLVLEVGLFFFLPCLVLCFSTWPLFTQLLVASVIAIVHPYTEQSRRVTFLRLNIRLSLITATG